MGAPRPLPSVAGAKTKNFPYLSSFPRRGVWGGGRQKMERKFLVLLRHGRFGTMICMEILSLIKFVLIQVFGLVISLVAAGLFIFWIIRKFHSWKIAAAFSVILVGISFFLFMPYA